MSTFIDTFTDSTIPRELSPKDKILISVESAENEFKVAEKAYKDSSSDVMEARYASLNHMHSNPHSARLEEQIHICQQKDNSNKIAYGIAKEQFINTLEKLPYENRLKIKLFTLEKELKILKDNYTRLDSMCCHKFNWLDDFGNIKSSCIIARNALEVALEVAFTCQNQEHINFETKLVNAEIAIQKAQEEWNIYKPMRM